MTTNTRFNFNFFFAPSQEIDTPKASLYFVFSRKVSTVIFIEGGSVLYRSQNEKTFNI